MSETPSLLQDWLREKANAPYFAAYRGDLLSIAHALDSLHRALTAERAARERAEAERDALRARIRDDSLAMTCQSVGQYRTALLAKEGA